VLVDSQIRCRHCKVSALNTEKVNQVGNGTTAGNAGGPARVNTHIKPAAMEPMNGSLQWYKKVAASEASPDC
jgi:hypothetical protein